MRLWIRRQRKLITVVLFIALLAGCPEEPTTETTPSDATTDDATATDAVGMDAADADTPDSFSGDLTSATDSDAEADLQGDTATVTDISISPDTTGDVAADTAAPNDTEPTADLTPLPDTSEPSDLSLAEDTQPPPDITSDGPGHVTFSLEGALYRMAAEPGAELENLSDALDALTGNADDITVSLSPDGSWLTLITERFDADCSGWACLAWAPVGLESASIVYVDGAVIHADGHIAIASAGLRIAYVLEGEIYLIERSDEVWGNPLNVTSGSPWTQHDFPAFSADGEHLVFDCGDEPQSGICEVGADGEAFRTLMTDADTIPSEDAIIGMHHPDYAPDGSVVFEIELTGEQIWRLAVGESVPERVTNAFGNDNSPCVLPDGRIASLWLDRSGGPGYHELKVMGADGSDYVMVLPNRDIFDIGLGCGE